MAPKERQGAANAFFSTATDLGIGLGAILLGLVSEYMSYSVLFSVSALSVFVALLLFAIHVKKSIQGKRTYLQKDEAL
ncbi:major facilitator superfamily transporter [compost metagenome]